MAIGKEGELPCLTCGRKMVLETAPPLSVIDSSHSFRDFMTEKMTRKLSSLVIYSYLKDGAFTAI